MCLKRQGGVAAVCFEKFGKCSVEDSREEVSLLVGIAGVPLLLEIVGEGILLEIVEEAILLEIVELCIP